MRNILFIIISLFINVAFAQVQLLPFIGLSNQPLDTDSVCTIIPRTQGNPWVPVSVVDTMVDFTLWDIN